MQWHTRRDLLAARPSAPAGSILFAGEPTEAVIGLGPQDWDAAEAIAREALKGCELGARDRVLIAMEQPASLSVALLARAAAPLVQSVAVTGARGRMRLLAAIRSLKPTVLITTPCGAADFLARLYMEFNVDPVELGLERIVIGGEVATAGLRKRLAREFEAEVAELYFDPFFGLPLAWRCGGPWEAAGGTVALAAPDRDEIVAEDLAADIGDAEIVVRPTFCAALKDDVLRTGTLRAAPKSDAGLFDRTLGDHVLLRGRWVSLDALRRQLALIDGVSAWTLEIDRGDRTLDAATLKVGFNRETLVKNPMWLSRVEQAIAAACPVSIAVETSFAGEIEGKPRGAVDDLRGHHGDAPGIAA
ncbi:hypothetical protein [Rhizorhabdus histidinilytica]|uniref:hypothetical protein n=1 Tax=Rhizorhabdus histidinilytica TaxID=439228 RepID=UPI00321F64C1